MAFLWFGVALGQGGAFGQGSATFPTTTGAPAAAGVSASRSAPAERRATRGVEPAPLEAMIYLPEGDDSPNLVPMPNHTLEDFDRLQRIKQGLEVGRDIPSYRLQSVVASGRCAPGDGHVRLSIRITIVARRQDLLIIPLGLQEGAIPVPTDLRADDAFRYDGPGRAALYFGESDEGGYRCAIRDATASEESAQTSDTEDDETARQLEIDLLVPIRRVGDAYHLALTFPRAISSELNLDVPVSDAVATVPETSILETQPLEDSSGGTQLLVRGLLGAFSMSWRPPSKPTLDTTPLLKVEDALILASLDSRMAEIEMTLPIRSYGAPFKECHIRLPRVTRWSSDFSPDYQIEEVRSGGAAEAIEDPPGTAAGTPASDGATSEESALGPLLLVRFAEETEGPVNVRLGTRRLLDSTDETTWFELGGIEVVEAEEMWGHVAVRTPGDWPIREGLLEGVHRVDRLPESLESEHLAARFEFYRQPFSIPARVVQRQTRINVKPSYAITVEKGMATLRASLVFNVSGAPTEQLQVDLRGWRFTSAEPRSVIDTEWHTINKDSGRLTLPLVLPPPDPIEITLLAHFPIRPDTAQLTLPLPHPVADWEDKAAITVQPADNIELAPVAEAIEGLDRQVRPRGPSATAVDGRSWQQEPLHYRGDTATAVFVAKMTPHSQEVGVDVLTDVDLVAADGQITQTFTYDVKHEPLDRLRFAVPKELAESQSVVFSFEGQPLPDAAAEGTAAPSEDVVLRRVQLPRACIGRFTLTARYGMKPLHLRPQMSDFPHVPLVMPDDGTLEANRVRIDTSSPGIRVHATETSAAWEIDESAAGDEPSHVLRLRCSEARERLLLTVYLEDLGVLGTTVIDRAWYQTWTGPDRRRDRVVYRFSSARDRFEWTMPEGVDATKPVQVLLDGQRPTVDIGEDGRLSISLPEVDPSASHVLELWYFMTPPSSDGTRHRFEFPELPEHAMVRRSYWQLVLPASTHLINPPAGLTPEFRWGWNRVYCGRVPLQEQADLELWSGAKTLPAVPEATSRYLFSALGPIQACDVHVVRRTTIVFWASGGTLLVGLLLIYWPPMRTPAVLLTSVVVLTGATALRPAPTLLLAQASSLGVVAALLAGILHRCVSRSRGWHDRETHSGLVERELGSGLSAGSAIASSDSGSVYPMSSADVEM